MDRNLAALIFDYQSQIDLSLTILECFGFVRPSSRDEWAFSPPPFKNEGPGPHLVVKHGYGCKINMERFNVDFDFGPEGEINGFDAWWLSEFARARPGKYERCSFGELKKQLEESTAAGHMVCEDGIYYLAIDKT